MYKYNFRFLIWQKIDPTIYCIYLLFVWPHKITSKDNLYATSSYICYPSGLSVVYDFIFLVCINMWKRENKLEKSYFACFFTPKKVTLRFWAVWRDSRNRKSKKGRKLVAGFFYIKKHKISFLGSSKKKFLCFLVRVKYMTPRNSFYQNGTLNRSNLLKC